MKKVNLFLAAFATVALVACNNANTEEVANKIEYYCIKNYDTTKVYKTTVSNELILTFSVS